MGRRRMIYTHCSSGGGNVGDGGIFQMGNWLEYVSLATSVASATSIQICVSFAIRRR